MRAPLAAVVMLSATGCIDDLPAPTGGGSCELAGDAVTPGCLSLADEGPGCAPTRAACFRTDAMDCSCSNACGPATCSSPDVACPSAVAAFGATCHAVPASPDITACNPCGCASCMQICDGLGPTFAIRPMGADRLVSWPLTMPDSGSLGVYIRARGRFDGMLIGVWGGNSEAFPQATNTANPETEHGDYLVRGLQTWDGPQMKPDSLAIGITQMNDVVIEIDCVVPFVE